MRERDGGCPELSTNGRFGLYVGVGARVLWLWVLVS
jgi:hypothetical protein